MCLEEAKAYRTGVYRANKDEAHLVSRCQDTRPPSLYIPLSKPSAALIYDKDSGYYGEHSL